jgi:hypothetical protein
MAEDQFFKRLAEVADPGDAPVVERPIGTAARRALRRDRREGGEDQGESKKAERARERRAGDGSVLPRVAAGRRLGRRLRGLPLAGQWGRAARLSGGILALVAIITTAVMLARAPNTQQRSPTEPHGVVEIRPSPSTAPAPSRASVKPPGRSALQAARDARPRQDRHARVAPPSRAPSLPVAVGPSSAESDSAREPFGFEQGGR